MTNDLDAAFLRHTQRPTTRNLNSLLRLVRDAVYRTHNDDIAQELVVYLLTHCKTITPKSTFTAWLFTAAKFKRITLYSSLSKQRAKHRPLDEDTIPVFVEDPPMPRDMEALAAAVRGDTVESKLIELILDGSTLRAAAEQLKIGETAARNRLRRLGAKLKKVGKDVEK
jgi:DNA-directed RNA polymerase specialized sigma24 family protein